MLTLMSVADGYVLNSLRSVNTAKVSRLETIKKHNLICFNSNETDGLSNLMLITYIYQITSYLIFKTECFLSSLPLLIQFSILYLEFFLMRNFSDIRFSLTVFWLFDIDFING